MPGGRGHGQRAAFERVQCSADGGRRTDGAERSAHPPPPPTHTMADEEDDLYGADIYGDAPALAYAAPAPAPPPLPPPGQAGPSPEVLELKKQ